MKANLRRLPAIVLLSFLVILGVWSCTDKPDAIGLDLLDENRPFVGYDTTFEVLAYSTLEDSVVSDETSVNLLGSIYSETFGRSNTSIYTQVRISALKPDWGVNPTADSVVFTMVYTGYYGNLQTEQTVRAYRILEDLERDSIYWSNISFETDPTEMAAYTFLPDLTDIPNIDTNGGTPDTTYLKAELRIPFDNAFADYMFNLDTAYTSSSDAFLDEFKGIHLRNDNVNSPDEGAILYFDLLDDRSNLTIYYKNDSADSLKFRFLINLNNARIGSYEHEYELSTNPNFIEQVLNGEKTAGSENLYLQGIGGVKTNIKFPEVSEWASSSNRVINEAKLIMNLSEEYPEGYEPSTSLILFRNTEDGSYDFVQDQLQGENYFNGNFDEASNSYYFRISLYLQNLLSGEPDLGLGLFPNAKSIKSTEMILYGTNLQNPRRFHLQITYTDAD